MNKIMGILLLLVYVCAASALLSDAFVTSYNMQNIVRYSALYGIIGIGVAFVIITGGIDLSIGSLIGLTGCILPMLLIEQGWSIPAALAAVMAVALSLGLGHGLLITKLNLQPFIVTLCGLLIYRGLARWITGDQTKGFGTAYDDSLRLLATGKPCSVAFLILVGGALGLLWSGWKWLSARREGNVPSGWGQLPLVGIGIGLVLIGIGSSRFWHGFSVETGETWLSLGAWELSRWTTSVPPTAEGLPQQWMRWAGIGTVPAAAWLLFVILSRSSRGMELPLTALAVGGALVWWSILVVRQPDDWFRPEEWARTWRMVAVFVSLGLLMGGLGWFCRRALRIGGTAAHAPLLLCGFFGGLWLIGQTPLGQTLVPAPVIFLIALASLAGIFLHQTIYGRYLLALGRNEEAARYSGIRTDRMVILAYVLCAGASGIGGILFALDGNSVQPAGHGNFLELYAIAAAVLGGCSLRGGEGTVLGVIIGAAVMRVLYNSINILGIPSQLEFAIIGTVILCGVLADELVKRFSARQSTA